ncbi:Mus7/MMS22 family-domain-containing protein [Mycena sanguinolenta]|nr:Mus7/MMS22 family-domain-containing protein [Mycena sanguinolenta]
MMDEIVETSDPEELEELRRLKPQIRPSSRDGRQSPRKRPKLHHEYSDIAPRTPPLSPSSSFHDVRSPRYQTMSDHTTPGLSRASSSKASSPVATPPVTDTDASGSPEVVEHSEQPSFMGETQDPLLLDGTESPKLYHVALQDDESPSSPSSPSHLHHDDPGDPMVSEPSPPSQSRRSRSESVDPLLLFTPSRPSLDDEYGVSTIEPNDDLIHTPSKQAPSSSPLPIPTPSPSPRAATRPRASPTGSEFPVEHPGDLQVARDLDTDNPRPYSLRQRQPQQIKPYQYDKARYHDAMRDLPEAIVKIRSPRRHHHREEDYEEDQTQEPESVHGNEAENHNGQEPRHRRSKSKSSPAKPQWIADALPPLPSDEEGEFDAVRKEARQARRALKKQQANAKAGRKTTKPFPLKPADSSDENDYPSRRSPSRRSFDRTHSPGPSTARVSQPASAHRARRNKSVSPALSSPPRTPRAGIQVFRNAHSISPPAFFDNDIDVDMENPGDFSPRSRPHSHTQQNNPGTPIVISDNESDGGPAPTLQESEPEETKEERKQRKRIEALNRMYPAFMRERMMDAAAPAKPTRRRRSPAVSSAGSDGEQPLLPGQTRVRRAKNPRNVQDIKGDSESSDDQMVGTRDAVDSDGEPAVTDSDVEVVWPRRKGRAPEDVWNYDEEVLSDGRIDDERIDAYLREAPVRGSGLQEKDMIDWMLANTAQIGGKRRPSTRTKKSSKTARSQGSTRPKIKVRIGGRKHERQTLLSFDKAKRGRSRDRGRSRPPPSDSAGPAASTSRQTRERPTLHQTVLVIDDTRSRSPPRRRDRYSSPERDREPSSRGDEPPSPTRNAANDTVHYIPDPDELRRAAKKQKEKERRARIKMQGIYVFIAPKGSRIDGQRTKAATSKGVAINVADRGFHKALAPTRSDKNQQAPRPPTSKVTTKSTTKSAPRSSGVHVRRRLLPRGDRPPLAVSDGDDAESDGSMGDEVAKASTRAESEVDVDQQAFMLDFGIPVVPSITFSMQTYIGKFALKQLVEPPPEAVRPSYFSAHGFDLGPNVSAPEFLNILGNICDRFFEFATGIPDADNGEQANEWSKLVSVACLLVSYLPPNAELKDAVATQILRLTSKMREASLTSASMDLTTFTICWFAVELAIRVGFTLPPNTPRPKDPPNPLYEACAVLIEHLLEYGLERGMEPLASEDVVDGSTVAHRAFEMWVCLWHVGHKYRHPTSTMAPHPLWKLVQTALQARHVAETSPLDASERAWHAIISLSTVSQMSQFPSSSRYVGASTMPPACWEMVVFALQQIGLEVDEELDKTMSDSALDNRDRYIAVVVERCCLLWSRWKWGLQDTSPTISQLIKVFQSRKFTDFRHEKAEFPDFIRLNDWTMLSQPIQSERTTVTTFVNFLKLVCQTLLVVPARAKKLLSLLAPVGHLPWSKSHPPSPHDLSQLYNRFSAFAVAIQLEPDGHAQWIQRARGYVQFKHVNTTARHAYIRGLMYLSSVMVQRNVELDESLSWLDEMVTTLLDEYKHQTGDRQQVVIAIHLLVGAVRNIIRAFKSCDSKRYPDPRLLLSLERILRDVSLVKPNNSFAHQVPRLIRSFLIARMAAVPAPRRPIITNQESQDEYEALAFDQDMIAAFEENDQPEYQIKDRTLCKLLDENITWTLFRQLAEQVKVDGLKESFKDNSQVSTDIATLIECWVGCGNILVHNSQKSWSTFLHAYKRWPPLHPFCQRRMDFLVFSNVLSVDPMAYLTLQDSFLIVFFEALGSWYTTSEDSYIKLLLSIDGLQHPLLRGVSWDSDLNKDTTSNIDLLDARLPLLTAILENLSNCLDEPGLPDEDKQSYVGYCNRMFSAMNYVRLELEELQSKDAHRSYTSWCLKVYMQCRNRPIIAGQDRLDRWMSWGENLQT